MALTGIWRWFIRKTVDRFGAAAWASELGLGNYRWIMRFLLWLALRRLWQSITRESE